MKLFKIMKNLLPGLSVALLAFSIGTLSQKVFKVRQTLSAGAATAKLEPAEVLKTEADDAPPINRKTQLNQV